MADRRAVADFVDRPLSEHTLRRDLGLARERAFMQCAICCRSRGRLSPLAGVRLLLASVPDDSTMRRCC